MPTPGAATSTTVVVPQLEKLALPPADVLAPTVITLRQLAGWKFAALALLLPAATTTVTPRETAPLIALWKVELQAPLPPRLRLITTALLVPTAGTPATAPPEAQVIASAMSTRVPPHLPSARAVSTLEPNAVPATPTAL